MTAEVGEGKGCRCGFCVEKYPVSDLYLCGQEATRVSLITSNLGFSVVELENVCNLLLISRGWEHPLIFIHGIGWKRFPT